MSPVPRLKATEMRSAKPAKQYMCTLTVMLHNAYSSISLCSKFDPAKTMQIARFRAHVHTRFILKE